MRILDRLTELESSATDGPWEHNVTYFDNYAQVDGNASCHFAASGPRHISRREKQLGDLKTQNIENNRQAERDAMFIVSMRNALPALLAVARAAKEQDEDQLKNGGAYDMRLAQRVHMALADLEALDE